MGECLDDNQALALLDGKLPAARRAAVETHLESCAACRELVVALIQDEPPTERSPAGRAFPETGPYRIEREVGMGAAGTVYRATHEQTGEIVAVKYVTDPSWRSRFRREVDTLARLHHPGIVRYIAHGETRQGLYLAMEWLEGEDLSKCIRRGPIAWPDVRALGLRLVAALAHAHAQGAIHRDIGPRNIFLPKGLVEHAKLLDFGLVRVPDAVDRTTSKAVIGTPQYMAPEQIKDSRKVDARSDLFSLGIVLFEALSGKRPFGGDDLYSVWNNIVDQPAPDLRPLAPTAPAALIELVERMLAKDPAARPQTAQAVHEALVRLEAPATEVGRFTGPMARPSNEPVGKGTAPMPPVGQATAPMKPLGESTAPMAWRENTPSRPVAAPVSPRRVEALRHVYSTSAAAAGRRADRRRFVIIAVLALIAVLLIAVLVHALASR